MNDKLDNLKKGPDGDYAVSSEVDTAELAIGVQSEMEHTNDIKIAKKIALDHLKEDPKYYTKLAKAGLANDFGKIPSSGYGDPDAHFNDPSRVGDNFPMGNMGGKIGNTPHGEVDGRRSEPVLNKTVEIELNERKKKSVPTDKKKWKAALAWAKRNYDVYPSRYATYGAVKRYKNQGGGWKMSEQINKKKKNFNNCYVGLNQDDDIDSTAEIGIQENKKNTSIMKKTYKRKDVEETIKQLIKEALEDSDLSVDDSGMEGGEMGDTDAGAETQEDVTVTIDRETAQKLCDILSAVLHPEDGSGDEGGEEMGGDAENLQESSKLSTAKSIVRKLKK